MNVILLKHFKQFLPYCLMMEDKHKQIIFQQHLQQWNHLPGRRTAPLLPSWWRSSITWRKDIRSSIAGTAHVAVENLGGTVLQINSYYCILSIYKSHAYALFFGNDHVKRQFSYCRCAWSSVPGMLWEEQQAWERTLGGWGWISWSAPAVHSAWTHNTHVGYSSDIYNAKITRWIKQLL